MNIFVLDYNPEIAAKWLVDKHCVKMQLESVQMLMSAHYITNGFLKKSDITDEFKKWLYSTKYPSDVLYGPTHRNHPCTVWVRNSISNYLWLCEHALHITLEYTARYGKISKLYSIIEWCIDNIPENIKNDSLTEFACVMDSSYIISDDVVANYRNYYNNGKSHLHDWKIPEHKPAWIS